MILATTRTTLELACAQAIAGEELQLTATVCDERGGPVGGQVAFADGALLLGSAPLVDGRATLNVRMRSTGDHRLKASFAGYDLDGASSDERVVVVLQRSETRLQTRTLSDGTVRLVALVAAAHVPSGEVSFHAGGRVLGKAHLNSGCAVLIATPAEPIADVIAVYHGDSHSMPSCST